MNNGLNGVEWWQKITLVACRAHTGQSPAQLFSHLSSLRARRPFWRLWTAFQLYCWLYKEKNSMNKESAAISVWWRLLCSSGPPMLRFSCNLPPDQCLWKNPVSVHSRHLLYSAAWFVLWHTPSAVGPYRHRCVRALPSQGQSTEFSTAGQAAETPRGGNGDAPELNSDSLGKGCECFSAFLIHFQKVQTK